MPTGELFFGDFKTAWLPQSGLESSTLITSTKVINRVSIQLLAQIGAFFLTDLVSPWRTGLRLAWECGRVGGGAGKSDICWQLFQGKELSFCL